jgi:uncharacterized protein (TIGR02300 family)
LDKADLGTKRVCPSCGVRFYDLTKRPIECPKCAFTFEPEAIFKQRRTRQAEVAAKPEAEEAEDQVEETEEEVAIEPAEQEHETVVADEEEEVAEPEPEHVAPGMQVVDSDDVEIEDIDGEEVEEDDADDALLEPEEDEDDVSGIIDADIEKDER